MIFTSETAAIFISKNVDTMHQFEDTVLHDDQIIGEGVFRYSVMHGDSNVPELIIEVPYGDTMDYKHNRGQALIALAQTIEKLSR